MTQTYEATLHEAAEDFKLTVMTQSQRNQLVIDNQARNGEIMSQYAARIRRAIIDKYGQEVETHRQQLTAFYNS